jgi:beta-glucosidase
VNLGARESKQVSIEIPANNFRYWDTTQKKYVVEPGSYELLIGGASNDIRLRVPFSIEP